MNEAYRKRKQERSREAMIARTKQEVVVPERTEPIPLVPEEEKLDDPQPDGN